MPSIDIKLTQRFWSFSSRTDAQIHRLNFRAQIEDYDRVETVGHGELKDGWVEIYALADDPPKAVIYYYEAHEGTWEIDAMTHSFHVIATVDQEAFKKLRDSDPNSETPMISLTFESMIGYDEVKDAPIRYSDDPVDVETVWDTSKGTNVTAEKFAVSLRTAAPASIDPDSEAIAAEEAEIRKLNAPPDYNRLSAETLKEVQSTVRFIAVVLVIVAVAVVFF